MAQDIKLKKICLKLFIVFFVILVVSIVIQELFNGVIKDSKGYPIELPFALKIIINIFIWMSAGISASAFTIWISKKFDYLAKRKDLLMDFFDKSLELMTTIKAIQPLTKECDINKVIESYNEFDEKRYLIKELLFIRNRLELSEKDEMLKPVDNVINFYKDIRTPIIWNSIYIKYELNSETIRKVCSNEPYIFDMGEIYLNNRSTIVYNNRFDNEIFEDMKKIEKYLFGKETLHKNILPNYFAREFTYIDDYCINVNPMKIDGNAFENVEEDDDSEE